MAVVTLQFVPSVPHYQFRCPILGVEYVFTARWNTRLSIWALDVADRGNARIMVGMPIVLGAYLGRTSSHPLFQGGVLLARDTSQSGVEAGLDDLGTRVHVRYYPRDDAAAEIAGRVSPA